MLCFGSLCICFFWNVVITFQASGRFSIRSRRAAGTSMGLEWLLCATRATAEIVAVAMATLATLATLATRATRRDQSQGSRPRGCYNLKSYQNLAVKLCERNDQYQIYHHSLELGSHFAQVEANLLQPLVDMASSVARAASEPSARFVAEVKCLLSFKPSCRVLLKCNHVSMTQLSIFHLWTR